MEKQKWAVIDIGSNTIRLVIYEKARSGSYKGAENIKAVARLRHYLSKDGELLTEGVALLIDILEGFKEIVDFHKVMNIDCVATATIRQSRNQQEIINLVKEKTGFDMQIFTEEEEAYFGFYAVSHSTSIDTGITIDIGGGSTEITYFQNRKLKHYHSFPFGVVSLKEQFMQNNRMTEDEHKRLNNFIVDSFKQLPWLKNLHVPVIAIGGSARNIAQIDQNIKRYPIAGIHQYVMSYSDLKQVQYYLERLTVEQLEKVEGLSKDRADIIVPALEVFVKLCEYSGSSTFMFSRKGLRDGISMHKSETNDGVPSTDQILSDSITALIADYDVDHAHSVHTGELAEKLFMGICKYYPCHDVESIKKFTIRGAQIYYLGQYVDDDASSQHTFYLLANQSINGLLHKDRVKLAFIASFKNKTLLKQYLSSFENWFTKEEMEDIRIAGAIAKVANALDASQRSIVRKVEIKERGTDSLLLMVYCQGKAFVEQYETEKHIRQLEKALNKTISLEFIPV